MMLAINTNSDTFHIDISSDLQRVFVVNHSRAGVCGAIKCVDECCVSVALQCEKIYIIVILKDRMCYLNNSHSFWKERHHKYK